MKGRGTPTTGMIPETIAMLTAAWPTSQARIPHVDRRMNVDVVPAATR